jgi:PAS domain S-box-containing protein
LEKTVAKELEFIDRVGPVFFDSYFVVDRERKILKFNDGLVQLLGFRPAQKRRIAGTACYELLKLEICRERCIALKCLEKDGPVRMEEIRGKTPDGRDIILELSAIPLRDDAGRIEGVMVTHRDVTDERRLKTKYEAEQTERRSEREALLKIIKDRDAEIERMQEKAKMRI